MTFLEWWQSFTYRPDRTDRWIAEQAWDAALASRPEAPFPSDREQAGLWRDLVLLDPMDLMVIYGGAENDVVLLGKLKEFIEAKRKEQATPQLHDDGN